MLCGLGSQPHSGSVPYTVAKYYLQSVIWPHIHIIFRLAMEICKCTVLSYHHSSDSNCWPQLIIIVLILRNRNRNRNPPPGLRYVQISDFKTLVIIIDASSPVAFFVFRADVYIQLYSCATDIQLNFPASKGDATPESFSESSSSIWCSVTVSAFKFIESSCRSTTKK